MSIFRSGDERGRALTRLQAESASGSVLYRPVDPALPPRLSPEDARNAVHKAVTELHATGSLDAGNADVLDGWIDTLRPQWHAHATLAATEHAAVAQLATGDCEATALAARHRADAANGELQRLQRLVDSYEQALLPGEGPEQPDRRHRRPDLGRLDGLTTSPWVGRAMWLLLPLVAAGDFVTFYMTLAGLLRENAVLTWILVGSFTFASVALMHATGHTAKNVREGRGGLGKGAVAVMTAVWALLGAVACYVRMQYVPTTAATDVAFGADPATATSTAADPLLSALLLLALYLASGALAFWVGFAGHHPRMSDYRKLTAQLGTQRETVATAERAALSAERLLAAARVEEERAVERAASAVRSVDAEIAELKQLARIHLAGLLGEPAATNAVTTGLGTDAAAGSADQRPVAPGAPATRVNGHPLPAAP